MCREVNVSWNGSHWVAETKEGRIAGQLNYVMDSLIREGFKPKIIAPETTMER